MVSVQCPIGGEFADLDQFGSIVRMRRRGKVTTARLDGEGARSKHGARSLTPKTVFWLA